MDIKKALLFVLSDDRWLRKLFIGAIIIFFSFLIFPLFFFYGYMLEIIRNVIDDLDYPLPEWTNWGRLFKDGLAFFVACLVYTLPVWLLLCCSLVIFIPGALLEGELSDVFMGVGVMTLVIMWCLVTLFLLAYALISPAIAIQYVREDEFAACFRINEILAITREHIGDIFLMLLVLFGLSMVISLAFVAPILGWVIVIGASIYVSFVTAHFYGQIGAKVEEMSRPQL